MPSTRRSRVLIASFAIAFILVFYFSRDPYSSTVETRTVYALEQKANADRERAKAFAKSKENADAVAGLDDSEQQRPLAAPETDEHVADDTSGPKKPTADPETTKPDTMDPESTTDLPIATQEGSVENSVTGRKSTKGGETKDVYSGKEAPMAVGKKEKEKGKPPYEDQNSQPKEVEAKTVEELDIEMEMNSILKRSPIIIFSKSYCPHSAKAKKILLEKYNITPAPYVVELDKHPLGAGVQSFLAKSTGRRTVPNILVNGVSIGGGDEIEALDRGGGMRDKIKDIVKQDRLEVKLRDEHP